MNVLAVTLLYCFEWNKFMLECYASPPSIIVQPHRQLSIFECFEHISCSNLTLISKHLVRIIFRALRIKGTKLPAGHFNLVNSISVYWLWRSIHLNPQFGSFEFFKSTYFRIWIPICWLRSRTHPLFIYRCWKYIFH